MKSIKNIFCVLLMVISFQAAAQINIDTIKIKTTQIPLKSTETGKSITVIKGEDLRNQGFSSLDDLLQNITGIEVQTRNSFGAQGDITMRGSTFTQVLVLVNNMKMNDPLTGHFNSSIPVTPSEIDRIEILRGPASANYGADAVGGVINIITKTFDSEGFVAEGEVNYGQNNLISTQHGFRLNKKDFYLGAGIAFNKSDGEYIEAKNLASDTLEGYNNYFDVKTLGISAGYRFSKNWNIKLRSSFDDRDFSARYFYTTSLFDKSEEKTANSFNQLSLNHIGDRSSTQIQFADRTGEDTFIFSPDFPSTNVHTTRFSNLNINHVRSLGEESTINIGVQMDKRSIESTDRGDHDDQHAAVYLSYFAKPIENLALTSSLRYDYDENFGSEITPQINASYRIGTAYLRASIGKSIRAADYTERFVSFNLENLTPGRSFGNADLIAERSWSEEIGLDLPINNQFDVKATAFFRQSQDLIDYVSTNSSEIPNNQNLAENENYFFAQNIENVQTRGIEISTNWNKKIGENKTVGANIGFSYINTQNDSNTVSVYVSSHAKVLLNANVHATINRLRISVNNRYKLRNERISDALGEKIDGHYNVINAMLQYTVIDQLRLHAKCFNLLDANNQDILGAPLPKRWVMGGFSYKL